ncbi:30S ribosomal protein S5 [Methanosalsum natronophilum]|uniref:Small ribosomal subunit protein uS5 n=1 Tax=Methanosalsum natronophilum TaxID=768733 RepID=A0A424YRZ2_9EURY|nr:30S ribosomal protein S5 [Methanosalsum natronophilum]MCS3924760.1 small subunit ribosomal protein S5 [Methanosalsum natronophilum]RQD81796.1 MAG: 30S ribosomal protein S5 [Methanosalsum natronophilum]
MAYEYTEEWIPKTMLGQLVQEGQITSMDEAIDSGLPIREPKIIDTLMPELEDEVLDINMVQRMTDSGRRVKFRATVIVGNGDGFVGLGQAKDAQVGPAIRKAIDNAKLNIIRIKRGCGSWECGCGLPHTVPSEVRGKAGSVIVELKPAPRGLGLAAGSTAKKVLEKAGIKDVWTRTEGTTRTTLNFAKATYMALKKTNTIRTPLGYNEVEAQ